MPELDSKIAEWRSRMAAGGIKTPAVLEELEGHLREEIKERLAGGDSEEEAFEVAVVRIGTPRSLRAEFNKVGSAMPAWARKMNYATCAVVSVFGLVAGLIEMFNLLHPQVPPNQRELAFGERISLASAFLSMGLLLCAWMFLWRFFPVLPRPQTRIASAFLCMLLSCVCATMLLRLFPLGAGTGEELKIAVVWACLVPLTVASALIFGLEEAAYRDARRRAG
jgi:hypothetical protein